MDENHLPARYGIVDVRRRQLYVPRLWDNREEAETERAALLVGFPSTSEWFERLQVLKWSAPAVTPGQPADREQVQGDGQIAA